MKSKHSRANILERLTRLRRVDRMQAIDELSGAHHEQQKVELLHERSEAMLKEASEAPAVRSGHDLANSIKFRSQIAGLASSTKGLCDQAEQRAMHARDRLSEANLKLEKIEERAAQANAAANRSAQDGTAIADGRGGSNHRSAASRRNA